MEKENLEEKKDKNKSEEEIKETQENNSEENKDNEKKLSPEEEIENAKKNDPIKLAIDNAKNYNLTKDDIETYKKIALDAVNSAFDFADTQPWPKGEDALEEVYVNYPREVN